MTLNRVLNPEGYVNNLLKEYGAMYCYNRKDHLGNIREVWQAAGVFPSATGQRTQYYPSGLPWASNTGDNPSTQPNKYNGKQFDEMHGYDTYDYGARGYYAAMGRFTTVDPLAEKYYSISPYAYCGGNPVNRIDPNGMDWFVNNNTGEVYYHNKLTTIDDKYAKENGLGSADSWERLGGDAMFDSKDIKYSSAETMYMAEKPAEGFMNDHGYEKAEKVSIKEEAWQSWEPYESYVGKVTYNHYELKQTSESKITFMKPEQLDRKTDLKRKEEKYDYNKFETVKYNLIKPFGQSNNKTAYYNGNVQSDNINTSANAVGLFFDLLKLFRK